MSKELLERTDIMYTDFTAQVAIEQHEHQLAERLERRRIAAERAVQEHGGTRLALIAHLARQARATCATAVRTPAAG